MARYVTSGARYNPFDFNAMWKTAEAATQAHYTQGAQFAALSEQMAPYETLKYNPVDSADYQQVTQYNQQLNDAVTKFQKQGLSGGSFNNFLQLSKNYSTNIKPLEILLKQREQYNNIVMQQQVADSTYEPVRTGNQISLREFASGGVTPYGVSGARVQQEVANIMTRIATQPNSDIAIKELNKYYNEFISQTGYTMDEVLRYINDPNASDQKSKILKSIVDGVVTSQKGFNELSPEAQNRIYEQARRGAYGAVGTTKQEIKESNWYQKAQLYYTGRADTRAQEMHDINKEYLQSKTNLNNAKAANGGYSGSEFKPDKASPVKAYTSINFDKAADINQEYQEKITAWMNYKNKKGKKPDTGGLSDNAYEFKLLEMRDEVLLQTAKYGLVGNTPKERKDFVEGILTPNFRTMDLKNQKGKTKSIYDIYEKRDSKYKDYSIEEYLTNFGTFYTTPTDPNYANGLLLDINGDTYTIPYSVFGDVAKKVIQTNIDNIKEILKIPSTQRNDKNYYDINSATWNIMNTIYSTTQPNGAQGQKPDNSEDIDNQQQNTYTY